MKIEKGIAPVERIAPIKRLENKEEERETFIEKYRNEQKRQQNKQEQAKQKRFDEYLTKKEKEDEEER